MMTKSKVRTGSSDLRPRPRETEVDAVAAQKPIEEHENQVQCAHLAPEGFQYH